VPLIMGGIVQYGRLRQARHGQQAKPKGQNHGKCGGMGLHGAYARDLLCYRSIHAVFFLYALFPTQV